LSASTRKAGLVRSPSRPLSSQAKSRLRRFDSDGHRITGRRTGYCSSQGEGWEFVHVAIEFQDSAGRYPDQRKESAVAFLFATIA